MSPVFRPYRPRDREACLAVFRSNVPRCFAPRARIVAAWLEAQAPSEENLHDQDSPHS